MTGRTGWQPYADANVTYRAGNLLASARHTMWDNGIPQLIDVALSQLENRFPGIPYVVFISGEACRTIWPGLANNGFTATNTRTGNTQKVTVRTPCQLVYRHAQPGATLTDISGTWSPPAANVRLWSFRNVAITSYNGTRGTICGPWPAEKHLAAPVITVRLIPPPVPRTAAGTSASW